MDKEQADVKTPTCTFRITYKSDKNSKVYTLLGYSPEVTFIIL